MTKRELLQHIISDYKARRDTATLIELYLTSGCKAGIGNPVVIQKVIDCVIVEAERQLEQLG